MIHYNRLVLRNARRKCLEADFRIHHQPLFIINMTEKISSSKRKVDVVDEKTKFLIYESTLMI